MSCLHHLIDAQSARTPDADALAFEGERLTYRELERRANALAAHLRGLGAGPEARVGLCVERSLEMVVALLAVLKSGAAYVPIGADDPAVPPAQLAAFEEEMRKGGVDWQLVRYGGAVHSFTQPEVNSPEHGAAYQPAAERRSWTAMLNFFDEIFR